MPTEDAKELHALGVTAVYTPKDFELSKIVGEVVAIAIVAGDA